MITSIQLAAQCSCTDCPVNTISNSTVTSSIFVCGASNPVLGQNGQRVQSVFIDYLTDAIKEVDMILYAPDGSFVRLIENTGIGIGQGNNFDIFFVTCDVTAVPDPSFNAFFDSNEYTGISNIQQNGSYYPANANIVSEFGCLESFTGPVAGEWILEIEDFIGQDDGTVFEWIINFEDPSGITCESCDCEADAGTLDNTLIEACQGDPILDVNMVPMYPNSTPPSTTDYGYQAVVYDANGIILEYVDDPDFTTYSEGSYTYCGLSYLLADISLIPPANGSYSITQLEADITASLFCADLSTDCNEIIIVAPLVPILIGPAIVCQGDLLQYTVTNLDPSDIFGFSVIGSFSFFDVNGSTLSVILQSATAEICVDAFNACGTVSDCISVVVQPPAPTIVIDGPTVVCPDTDYSYTLSPSLQQGESYNVIVTGGNLVQASNNEAIINWDTPGSGMGEICVTLFGGSCMGMETCMGITVLDINLPDEIFLDSPLCNGEMSFASVMASPDVTNYIWNLTNLTEVSGNGTSTISYTAGNLGIATVCLTMESACGLSDEICENIQIISAPEPTIFLTSSVCDYSFSLATDAMQNTDIQWSFLTGPSNPMINNPTSQSTNITVSAAGQYIFGVEVNDNGCMGTATFLVEVFDPLSLSTVNFECNDQQEYVVIIEILGGEMPYFVNNSPLTGSVFTSDFIVSGDNFSFTIEDDQACGIPVLTGTYECSCITDAGSMPSELLQECARENNSVQSLSLLDTIMAPGDVGFYVLHDNSGPTLGNIIEINETGLFFYQSGIVAGETYYISFVLGQAQNGFVDQANPCTSVSLGQAVVFEATPSVLWNVADTICDGAFFIELFDQMNIDSISWEFISGPAELTIEITQDSTYFWAPEPNTYEYNLLLYNATCDTVIPFTFIVPSSPIITAISEDCTLDPSLFTLSFMVDGDQPPFTVSLPGSFSGSLFTSDPLSAADSYQVIVVDEKGCESMFIAGPINCSCDIDIGSVNLDTFQLCEGELFDPSIISNGDFSFDPSIYTVAYYSYAQADDPIDQFIAFSYGDNLNQMPDYADNEVYFLRMIISTTQTNPQDGLVLDDPCLTISEVLPFYWLEDYDFIFDIHPTVCVDENVYSFEQNFAGPFPYSIGFINGDGVVVEFEIDDTTTTLSFPIYEGSIDWVLNSFQGDCGFSFEGNLNITGEIPVEFQISELDTLCNNTLFGSVLNLTDLLSIPDLIGLWTLNGEEVVSDIIDFDGNVEGTYELIFESNGGSGSCPLFADTAYIYIEDCSCPQVFMVDQVVCGIEELYALQSFTSTVLEGVFSISNSNNLDSPPIILPDNVLLTNVTPGVYIINYTLSGEWPPDCELVFSSELEVEEYRFAGEPLDTLMICENEEMNLSLFDLLTNYDEGGQWFTVNVIISDSILTESLAVGDHAFIYEMIIDSSCAPNQAIVNIRVNPKPDVEVLADDVLCFGDVNGVISISILNENEGPFTCALNGAVVGAKEINNLPPGFYTVEVTTQSNCVVIIDSIEIDEPEVIQVELGNDLLALYDDELIIEAIINLVASDVSNVTWQDLGGIIDENDLVLIQNATQDNTITITISDDNGCIASDFINIRLVEVDIDLANIFIPDSENEENRRFGMPYLSSVTEVIEFRIYDRWGSNVFTVENQLPGSQEGYWYGNFNGQQVQQGVYPYYLRYRLVSGEEKMILGDVTVMR